MSGTTKPSSNKFNNDLLFLAPITVFDVDIAVGTFHLRGHSVAQCTI